MKKNKFMFWSGLILTIGSFFLIPLILGVGFFFMGGSPEEFFNNNAESGVIILIVLITAATLIPVAGVLLLAGSVLIPLFSKMMGNSRIIKEGVSAEAKILEINETGTLVNYNPVVKLSLEVRPPGQTPFVAETNQTVSVVHLPSYQPGKMLNVKYLPETEKVAVVGPKAD